MKTGLRALALALGLACPHLVLATEQKTTFYGYINSYWEKAQDQAVLNGKGTGTTRSDSTNSLEYDVRDIHFVMQSTLEDRFKTFLNLKAPGAESVEVSNAWVEANLADDYLAFRLGKFYRPFEIYNEILDAVPTYIGIEPPELFDKDHLMLTRTTNMMFHGSTAVGAGHIRYAATTGNDERGGSGNVPIGLDLRYIQDIKWLVGSSFYTTGGRAKPINEYQNGGGSGAPEGGVLPWMDGDTYNVWGAYAQFQDDHWTVQASLFTAGHQGTRNRAAVADMCSTTNGTALNLRQQERFNCAGGANNENLNADYNVTSWYTRVGYNIFTVKAGVITPYAQYDAYKNEETIQSKSHGGDNEAGQSDDGAIEKWTVGVVYRPLNPVAIKLDQSLHKQEVFGKDGSYGETRFSLSYYWRM